MAVARGARVAEAKAPFPNAGGPEAPLPQRRSDSSAPSIENDMGPPDVRERPGALDAASARGRVGAGVRDSPAPRANATKLRAIASSTPSVALLAMTTRGFSPTSRPWDVLGSQ